MNLTTNKSTAETRWIVEGKGLVTDADFSALIAKSIVDLHEKLPSLPKDEQRNYLAALDKFGTRPFGKNSFNA